MKDELKTNETQQESFRDRLATVDAKGKRNWVFAHKPKGKFYNIRTLVSLGFFIIFFALPFIIITNENKVSPCFIVGNKKIKELVKKSYDIVVKSLTKKERETLANLEE